MSELTTDDVKHMTHLVIMTKDVGITVSTHRPPDGWRTAHDAATKLAIANPDACVTVACRIRQIYTPASEYLSS